MLIKSKGRLRVRVYGVQLRQTFCVEGDLGLVELSNDDNCSNALRGY